MNRLTKRADFLAARDGLRVHSGTFLLQARDRKDSRVPRVGLTVTKKAGNAVERNRIRRRLRTAVNTVVGDKGRQGFDYVLIARREAIKAPFPALIENLERALKRLHKTG
jgi:ribonuclease P protein component